ncbi:hypothetical protein [Pseudoalteromonas phage PH357]|nr:hypothetical protein [Pseudoalteromonas phage PH357]
MEFVIINRKGEYGVEKLHTGFGGNGTSKLTFTPDINKATLFTKSSYDMIQVDYKRDIVAKIPAEETRVVSLIGGEV